VRSGFLGKDDDAVRQRRPLYRTADPVIRFHQVVRHPRVALFEDGRGVEAWADAQPSFESLVLGPHFEQLARDHVRRIGETLVGTPIVTVGTTVLNDKGTPRPTRSTSWRSAQARGISAAQSQP